MNNTFKNTLKNRNEEDKIYSIFKSSENEFLVGIDDEFLYSVKSNQCPHCKQYKKIIKYSDIAWGGRDACLSCLHHNENIAYACCGHGNYEDAYILTIDGERFVLPKYEGHIGSELINGENITVVYGINRYVSIELDDGRVFYLKIIKGRLSE